MGADFENSPYAFGQSERTERVQCIIIKEISCLNKSGYGQRPIAILAQSFVVFFKSPVNRAQARQHWGVFFWDGG